MGTDEIIPNFTLFIQMGLFFVCYFVLNHFVFKPYGALLEARHARTIGLKEKSIQDRERAEKFKLDYETFMRNERRNVAAWMDDERRKIAEEEKAILQKARGEVSQEMAQTRTKLAHDLQKARKELMPLVTEYSSKIASKLLAKKVDIGASYSERVQSGGVESSLPG